jgi:thymidylate kinase
LLDKGYDARHCVQEHSFVPDMWQRQSRPEVLVYLDVSLPVILKRRGFAFNNDDLIEQRRRLAHAREHCHIYVDTDRLSEEQVLHQVIAVLETLEIKAPGS